MYSILIGLSGQRDKKTDKKQVETFLLTNEVDGWIREFEGYQYLQNQQDASEQVKLP